MEDDPVLLRLVSSWVAPSRARKRPKHLPATRRTRQAGHCVLRLERLEGRELLSIGLGLTAPPPSGHPSAAQTFLTATKHAVAAGDSTDSAPVISGVAVNSPQGGEISWNVTDAAGVQSSSVTIDGNAATKLYGPFTAASGVNYAAVYGTLAVGPHTFVITATDSNGATSQDTGTFTLVGPAISRVAIASPQAGEISWNVLDAAGVQSSSITIDGNAVTRLSGPFTAASGVNYVAVYGTLAGGSHTYVITATDSNGTTSQDTGTFTLAGPTISGVAFALRQQQFSWNVADAAGVQSSSITIDGNALTKLYGPFTAASGVNYAAVYGTLAAGSHTYVITATDRNGTTAQRTGSFTLVGPTISGVTVVEPQVGEISWNATDAAGVQSSGITIDGNAVTRLAGPFAAASGANYAAFYGTLATGAHTYVITATDGNGTTSQYTGSFTLAGPTISGVVVSHTMVGSLGQGEITWNVAGPAALQSCSITIDGNALTNLEGPYPAAAGVNYAAVYGVLPAGPHTCVITATDANGVTAQYSRTFTLAGATISGVNVDQPDNQITWSVADPTGVQSCYATIDGSIQTHLSVSASPVPGSANFILAYNTPVAGTHTLVITVTNEAGTTSQYTGTFIVGPVISGVVVATNPGQISWNVADGIDISSSYLTVDGSEDHNQFGPFTAANGSSNYFVQFGTFSAGTHNFVITAVDNDNNSATYDGSFTLS
jgi:hypothetical protein